MVKNIDILVLGDYFFDLIYSGLPEMPSLGREVVSADMVTTGGAMFITAAALRRLDVSVCWPAQFGSDPYSAYVRGLALDEGIDLSLARTFEHPFRRVTSSMPLHGERAFLTYIDPQPDDVYEFWGSAARSLDYRHLHLGSLHYADQIVPIIAEARKKGATVSLDSSDTHHLTTTTDWDALLTLLDIFMPNAREARLITGLDNIPDSLASLRRMVPTIVIKDGERGAWAQTQIRRCMCRVSGRGMSSIRPGRETVSTQGSCAALSSKTPASKIACVMATCAAVSQSLVSVGRRAHPVRQNSVIGWRTRRQEK